MSVVAARSFHVNGYCLAAREWHATAPIKILALHGWLDNAASFDVLAPLLVDCHIVALDLPGHGYSEHKSPQASYNIWDDLLDILAVSDALGWQRFHLLGHSRGAIISLLLAASSPERVQSMLLLDGIWPLPAAIEESAVQLARYIKESRSLADKNLPAYPGVEEALAARCRGAGMSELAARPIVERGLQQRNGVYHWANDPRLTAASAFKLSQGHIDAVMAAITMPCLVLLAEQGMGAYPQIEEKLASYASLRYQLLPGSHHFHMEAQAAQIASIASEYFSAGSPG